MITRWLARMAWNFLGAYMDRSSIRTISSDWEVLLMARSILLRMSEEEER